MSDAAAALGSTDDGVFRIDTFLDVGTRRTLAVVTATFGERPFGRVFFAGGSFSIADIERGVVSSCAVEQGDEGTPCEAFDDCENGQCLGLVEDEGPGRCVFTDDRDQPARGSTCTTDAECPGSEGLICMLLGETDGVCDNAWLRRRLVVADKAAIAGPVTTIPFVVSGVATVSLRTTLSMTIVHPRPDELTISVQHPFEASQAVLFADPEAVGPAVTLEQVRALLPSDESINGTWHLIVEDAGAGDATATLTNVEISVDSWFD